jgi:NAD(P)-dependent dehydrogenase (short-subunit alcohol dehydrogenase family)
VLIIGARSDIGRAIAAAFAQAGCPVILAARDAQALAADVADLSLRSGTPARAVQIDVLQADPAAFFDSLGELPRTVISVVGLMGEHAQNIKDPAAARRVMDTNYIAPALLLAEAANRLEAAGGGGCLVGISSVAGDRGRKTNYVYGSAKAGFSAFLSGLRHRFGGTAIRVVTVKPGFVDTAMTAGMNLPKPLTAQPEEVGKAVLKACRGGSEVIYVRPIWWLIMQIITHLPEPIFKKTRM